MKLTIKKIDDEKHLYTQFDLERQSLLYICKENNLDFNVINNQFFESMSSRETLNIKAHSSFISPKKYWLFKLLKCLGLSYTIYKLILF